MNRCRALAVLFLSVSPWIVAQTIPGRYIVEFNDEPAAVLMTPRLGRLAKPADLGARRGQIQATHDIAAQSIQRIGGAVRARFDLVFNGMAVDISDAEVDRLRQLADVRGVYPVVQYRAHMDHAVNVHKIRDAWQVMTGGQMGAGDGIKIGILDSGIDTAHPAFTGLTKDIPAGFPKLSSEAMRPFSNSKVIVVRDYTGEGGADIFGHGTGVAMAAAGGTLDLKIPSIPAFTGAAPGAWLGSYHVISHDGTTDSALFLQALQDAIADGMNVVNYSAGGTVLTNSGDNSGPQARAISAALSAGVLVVISAGNEGPDAGTVSSPGTSADAITVGANINERTFSTGVTVGDLPSVAGRPGSNSSRSDRIVAPMVDVATLDPAGLACSSLPPGSVKGKIVLISRGTCAFDDKSNNAELSGAIGVVVYNDVTDAVLVQMSVPTATVPTMFVTNASGLAIKAALGVTPELMSTIDYSGFTPVPLSSDGIAFFSSGGPTIGAGIKPDLVAAGAPIVTATTTQGSDFLAGIEAGTSFSAPLVTGSIAALMSARPGLTAAQYRSLIVNSAPRLKWSDGDAVGPMIGGNGKLDLLGAFQNTTVAAPTSMTFNGLTDAYDLTQSLVITNVGNGTNTYTTKVSAINTSGTVPTLDADTFTLNKGESRTIRVHVKDDAPTPGEYQGFVEVAGTNSPSTTRVPYWLGVRGGGPKSVAILSRGIDGSTHSFGDEVSFYFRMLDAAELPAQGDLPVIISTAPRSQVLDVSPAGTIPGTYNATVRVGRADTDGLNVFTIKSGDAEREVIFLIQ